MIVDFLIEVVGDQRAEYAAWRIVLDWLLVDELGWLHLLVGCDVGRPHPRIRYWFSRLVEGFLLALDVSHLKVNGLALVHQLGIGFLKSPAWINCLWLYFIYLLRCLLFLLAFLLFRFACIAVEETDVSRRLQSSIDLRHLGSAQFFLKLIIVLFAFYPLLNASINIGCIVDVFVFLLVLLIVNPWQYCKFRLWVRMLKLAIGDYHGGRALAFV